MQNAQVEVITHANGDGIFATVVCGSNGSTRRVARCVDWTMPDADTMQPLTFFQKLATRISLVRLA